jgi:Ca-activated chloride channel family protein
MVTFDKPQVLFGFVIFIPLIILAIYHYHKYRPIVGLLASSVPIEKHSQTVSGQNMKKELQGRYMFSCLFFGIFLACIIVALAGPRWGRRIVMEYRRGVDVVLAIDLSRSMDVQDIPGILMEGERFVVNGISRLDRAIGIAEAVAKTALGIRFGTAIGKGKGILAVPLTYDNEAVLSFLQGLSSSSITGRGTNLEVLLEAASGAFQDAFPTQRVIMLFSDGESLSGSFAVALDRILKAEITIIALGLGTEHGGPVPQNARRDEEGDSYDPVPVMSYRRDAILRNIAERTGGIYVDGNTNNAADLVSEHIRSLSSQAGTNGYHFEAQTQWRLFVILALVRLGIVKLLEKRLRK